MVLPCPDEASRIFCVGRNYRAHVREMAAEMPTRPVLFLKPGTARRSPGPVPLPRDWGRVDHEGELALLLGEEGRILALAPGVDLTLREEQSRLKAGRLPWDVAKAFDGSALLGEFTPLDSFPDEALVTGEFELRLNGQRRQHGRLSQWLFSPEHLLAELFRYWRPRAGDVLLTGTPEGVGPLVPGDVLEMAGLGSLQALRPARWEMEKAP